jgi:glycerophosphoryl diester phosphodiesterase
VKIIAHRGASGYHPEMTQDAYETAFALGADGVECDIQLTSDGVAVCLHDPTVDRTSDGTGAVNTKTLAELRELNFGTVERPQRILTLAELLGLVKDAQRPDGRHDYRPEIFVETKRLDTFAERRGQLEHALQSDLVAAGLAEETATGPGADLVHLISFDPGSLARFRKINPGIHRVYLRKEYTGWKVVRHLEPACVAQSPGFAVTRARTAPQGLGDAPSNTYLYTLNTPGNVRWAQRHDIGWIATDFPDRARGWCEGATRSGA